MQYSCQCGNIINVSGDSDCDGICNKCSEVKGTAAYKYRSLTKQQLINLILNRNLSGYVVTGYYDDRAKISKFIVAESKEAARHEFVKEDKAKKNWALKNKYWHSAAKIEEVHVEKIN